jgi:hypothetical protein
MIENQWHCKLNSSFSKSFAKTNTSTSKERCETKRISRFAFRRLSPDVIWCMRIKSTRFITMRFSPLNRIMMNFVKQNCKIHTFLKHQRLSSSLTNQCILRNCLYYWYWRWWLYPQTLAETVVQIFKFRYCIIIKSLQNIFLNFLNRW